MNKEAPKGWKSNKLTNICLIKGGKRLPKGETLSDIPTSHPYIRVTDFERYSVNLDNIKYITDEIYNVIKNYTISSDDLYISIAGSTGMIGAIPEKLNGANLTENAAKIVIKDQNIIDKNYLKYYLNSSTIQQQIKELTVGVGVPKLALNRIEGINIVYPNTIAEQREIAQVLDTMSDIIRLREECISHAQDLIPALFQEMFGDANNNITKSTIVRFRDCIDLNPSKPNLDDNLNVTFLGMKDINEKGQVDLSTTKTYEEVKKGFTNFENEDVLLAKITPCFENGKAAIVRNLLNGYGFGSTEFYVLRPHQNIILPEYVYAIIKSYTFAEPGKYKMTGAAGQKRLPKDYILNYKFPLPPLEAQEQFAEKVREINSYIEEQQEELENAKQMFQSLLHHAFTGELTNNKPQGDTLEK